MIMHSDTSMTRFMISSFFTLNSIIVKPLLLCTGYRALIECDIAKVRGTVGSNHVLSNLVFTTSPLGT